MKNHPYLVKLRPTYRVTTSNITEKLNKNYQQATDTDTAILQFPCQAKVNENCAGTWNQQDWSGLWTHTSCFFHLLSYLSLRRLLHSLACSSARLARSLLSRRVFTLPSFFACLIIYPNWEKQSFLPIATENINSNQNILSRKFYSKYSVFECTIIRKDMISVSLTQLEVICEQKYLQPINIMTRTNKQMDKFFYIVAPFRRFYHFVFIS